LKKEKKSEWKVNKNYRRNEGKEQRKKSSSKIKRNMNYTHLQGTNVHDAKVFTSP